MVAFRPLLVKQGIFKLLNKHCTTLLFLLSFKKWRVKI